MLHMYRQDVIFDISPLFDSWSTAVFVRVSAAIARRVADSSSTKKKKVLVAACIPSIDATGLELDDLDRQVYLESVFQSMLPHVDIWFLKQMS